MKPPVIFDYLDYRAFLADMFRYRKQQFRYFSYRFFARKSGFKSPNFLKLVCDGQRNLSSVSIPKIAKGFGLKKKDRDYFEQMVFMNQAASHEEKNHYYQKLMAVKGYSDIRKIGKAEYDYFSKWYYPVIRELIMMKDRRQAAKDIAPLLNPPVAASKVKKALSLMLEIGLIQKDEQGRWEQLHRNLSTGPEVRSLIIANYHREMLRLASESLERYNAKERDVTAVVLSVEAEKMVEIKEKTAAFRKDLLELASGMEAPDQVVQVNIQVFPLTKKM